MTLRARSARVSTVVSLVLFLLLRGALGAVGANAVAVSATFVANTWANARFTLRVHRPRWRPPVAIYVGSLALTSAALAARRLRSAAASRAELVVLVVTWMRGRPSVVSPCVRATSRRADRPARAPDRVRAPTEDRALMSSTDP